MDTRVLLYCTKFVQRSGIMVLETPGIPPRLNLSQENEGVLRLRGRGREQEQSHAAFTGIDRRESHELF